MWSLIFMWLRLILLAQYQTPTPTTRLQWRREGGSEGGIRPGRHCEGVAFGGAKIWNSEISHSQLSILFIVVTIRITIGDLIAGVRAATKTFAPGGKHPPAATAGLIVWHTDCVLKDNLRTIWDYCNKRCRIVYQLRQHDGQELYTGRNHVVIRSMCNQGVIRGRNRSLT